MFSIRVNKDYYGFYIKNEFAEKGANTQDIYQIYNNQQIDWYLQAELAYNKRFGATAIIDQKIK